MSRQLPDWIDAYMDYTFLTEPRPLFRKWCAVSAIAACLRRKCYLSLGMETFYPNFYIVLVGPPASRKGTAIKPALSLIDSIGIARAADESSRQKLITRLATANATEYTEATKEFTLHSSLTIVSSELTVFLGYNNLELLTTLCKWYDCESEFKYETIGRGTDTVTNVWVNLLGATTPTLLKSSLPQDAIGSGFTSRTIFVFEENKQHVVIVPTDNLELRECLKTDLEDIAIMKGRFVMTEEYLDLYGAWRENNEENPPFTSPELLGYIERRHLHLLKLSMVFSASRGNSLVLTRDDFIRSNNLLLETELKMPRVFQGIGRNPIADIQVRVMERIACKGTTSVRELMEEFYSDLSLAQLMEVIQALEKMDYCSVAVPSQTITFNTAKLRR